MRLEQPPRVRRNFLTWAFFLAQASAAELLLTGGAKAQDDDLSENSIKQPDTSSAPLPDDALHRSFEVAEAQFVAPSSNSVVGSQVTPHLDTPIHGQSLPPPPVADHALPGGTVGGATAGAGSTARVGSSGSAENSLPPLMPDIDGGEQPAPPAIDVHIGLSPLLGFDLEIGSGGLIAGVDLDLGNLVDGPLESVTGLVNTLATDLVADLGNLLNNDLLGLGEVLESGPLNLSALTGLTLTDGVAGLLGGVQASVDNNAGTPAPLISLSTTDGELSAPGLLSTGMINFPAVAASVHLDELFALGQHTDYNIALRTSPESDAGDALPSLPDVAAILPEVLPHEAPPPADDSASTLLSPMDEFLTRPTL